MYVEKEKSNSKNEVRNLVLSISTVIIITIICMINCDTVIIDDLQEFRSRNNVEEAYSSLIEHLEENYIIYDKEVSNKKSIDFGTKSDKYVLKLKALDRDYKTQISLSSKSEYNRYNINDKIVLKSDVYYTKDGIRLGSIDIITGRLE